MVCVTSREPAIGVHVTQDTQDSTAIKVLLNLNRPPNKIPYNASIWKSERLIVMSSQTHYK